MKFDTTQQLIDSFRAGAMVVLVDDDDENLGGVLLAPAETITAEKINFMSRQARGLICLSLTTERCEKLRLPLMVARGDGAHATRFTVSIEAAEGISTGISAADRAHTIRVAVARASAARDLVQPGHIFPLRAELGGVLKRAGHTEGGCDLARLAGYEPAAVLADVLNDDGTLATGAGLQAFAERHQLRIGTIAGLINFRLAHETTVSLLREESVTTAFGPFRLHLFRDQDDQRVHVALSCGAISAAAPCLVRVHVAGTLRDLLFTEPPAAPRGWNSARCLERMQRDGHGVFVLLNQPESEGHLLDSIDTALGTRTLPVTPRVGAPGTQYLIGVGSQILRRLGVGRMRVMGPPVRYNAISGFGLEVVEYVQE